MKRYIAFILLLLSFLTLIVSCTNDKNNETINYTNKTISSEDTINADIDDLTTDIVEEIIDVRETNENESYFYAETNREPLSYKVGDEIIFNVYLKSKGKIVSCPKFVWEILTDDGKHYSGECSGDLRKYVKIII